MKNEHLFYDFLNRMRLHQEEHNEEHNVLIDADGSEFLYLKKDLSDRDGMDLICQISRALCNQSFHKGRDYVKKEIISKIKSL